MAADKADKRGKNFSILISENPLNPRDPRSIFPSFPFHY